MKKNIFHQISQSGSLRRSHRGFFGKSKRLSQLLKLSLDHMGAGIRSQIYFPLRHQLVIIIKRDKSQYSYVMKRVTASSKPPPRKPKLKHKVKSKEKRFDPLEYLNALIDEIQDHSQSTVRKRTRSSAKRQLASAMARTIPHTERSMGCSKVRSKSSHSQPRRKSLSLRDPLKINLNIVTQQDNIQFTQSTIRQSENLPSRYEIVPVVVLTKSAAARKIQRAWRNYQTLKVVRKYFEFYQDIIKRQRRLKEIQNNNKIQEPRTIKRQHEHTLKIRKQQKNVDKTAEKGGKNIFRALEFAEAGRNSRQTQFFMDDLQTLELPLLRETQSREETVSKQLQLIVDLFRNTHQAASKQIEYHFDSLYRTQFSIVHSLELSAKEDSSLSKDEDRSLLEMEGLSPLIFEEMTNTVRHKYELYRLKAEEQLRSDDRRRALEQLEGRFLREMRAIDKCKQQYLRSVQQLKESMLKMKNDQAEVQKIYPSIAKVRKSYSADTLLMKSILEQVSFKNMDLDISKEELPFMLDFDFKKRRKMQEKVQLAVPTSPPSVTFQNPIQSAGKSQASLSCYQMDSDRKLRQALLECSDQSQRTNLFAQQIHEIEHPIKQFSQQSQGELARCSSTSSVVLSLDDNECRQGERSRMIRECSEQIEQTIETSLLDEIVLQIYSDVKMWSNFKSIVETPFSFRAQTDQQIYNFLEKELPNFYGSQLELIQRINQKINPTSLEILRLIRDYDFEIEEYELILPEEVFKKYRKHLEDQYLPLITKEKERHVGVDERLPQEVKELVVARGTEKKNKNAKFLGFQRDLKIMYHKAIFNCFNEMIIETKSAKTHMNCRSSIGPGELTLALKEYNSIFSRGEALQLMAESRQKITELVSEKCSVPQFKNHRDIETFQKQISQIIRNQLHQTQYKWVNYMDEVLQLWQELALWLSDSLFAQATQELQTLLI